MIFGYDIRSMEIDVLVRGILEGGMKGVPWNFGEVFFRIHADDACVGNLGMSKEYSLEFCGGDFIVRSKKS